jgi:hypothetical protein
VLVMGGENGGGAAGGNQTALRHAEVCVLGLCVFCPSATPTNTLQTSTTKQHNATQHTTKHQSKPPKNHKKTTITNKTKR